MYKNFSRIKLNKSSDILTICQIATRLEQRLYIHNDSDSEVINAKSILGCLYAAASFENLFLVNLDDDFLPEDFNDYLEQEN